MQLYDTTQIVEQVILVGVKTTHVDDVEGSFIELAELVRTAKGKVVGTLIQNRETIHARTYIGKGKIEELIELIQTNEATGIVTDDELTPAQLNHLEQELGCKVIDRTMLILDIFAGRAISSEGKIQVELAQLRYRSSRLIGIRNSLSRLGGGIGTRGPGEKKLEMDRRLIRERISQLKQELEEVKQHRELIRTQRKRSNAKVAALVGYTCAGKSSILNALTDAKILEDDMLFSTLDTTTRALVLPDKKEILLSDTVGFIRKLPHHLIEAFKSTLEEACYADIIIHVVDVANPQMELQMHVVYETLRQLKVENKPIITLFNKQDKREAPGRCKDFKADASILTSAKTKEGLEELKEVLLETLRKNRTYIEKIFSYEDAGQIQMIRKNGELLEEEYLPEGISVKAYVTGDVYAKLMKEKMA
ncbi:GTPase HflX [Lachnospiraceae bacterium ZAX-1]